VANPRIAWFTPLEPVESGISLYCQDLLPLLSQVVPIDVVVDGYAPTSLHPSEHLQIVQYCDYRSSDYTLNVYQVGNSAAHLYMLDEVVSSPGLLVLHDTVLNHLFVQQAARSGTIDSYREQMRRRYGSDGERAANRVLKGQAPDDLFRFPMSEPLVSVSVATLVHSEFARRQVLSWVPDSSIYRVPSGMCLPEEVSKHDARMALGLPADQFLIASITHVNPYKRLDVVLRAFKHLRREVPARFVIAGSVSPNYPLVRQITHLGLDQVVDVLGYVDDLRARLIAAAADVIVNLRYPTAGETSASLLHGMAAGRPVIISDTGSFAEVPQDAAIRVSVDAIEEPMLLAIFRKLASDPALADEIGDNARSFVAAEHSLERWVIGYVDAIASITGLELRSQRVESPLEPVPVYPSPNTVDSVDTMVQSLAREIAELGLGGDGDLMYEIAVAISDLGLGAGKMDAIR
jgi:glycosyltransferase involved in cell wall biosynthesis